MIAPIPKAAPLGLAIGHEKRETMMECARFRESASGGKGEA